MSAGEATCLRRSLRGFGPRGGWGGAISGSTARESRALDLAASGGERPNVGFALAATGGAALCDQSELPETREQLGHLSLVGNRRRRRRPGGRMGSPRGPGSAIASRTRTVRYVRRMSRPRSGSAEVEAAPADPDGAGLLELARGSGRAEVGKHERFPSAAFSKRTEGLGARERGDARGSRRAPRRQRPRRRSAEDATRPERAASGRAPSRSAKRGAAVHGVAKHIENARAAVRGRGVRRRAPWTISRLPSAGSSSRKPSSAASAALICSSQSAGGGGDLVGGKHGGGGAREGALEGGEQAALAVVEQLVERPSRYAGAGDDMRDRDAADSALVNQFAHRGDDPCALQFRDAVPLGSAPKRPRLCDPRATRVAGGGRLPTCPAAGTGGGRHVSTSRAACTCAARGTRDAA